MFEPNLHSNWQVHWKAVSPKCSVDICTLLRQSYGFTGVQSVTLVDEEWQQTSKNYKVVGQMGDSPYRILVRKNILGDVGVFRLITSISAHLRENLLPTPRILPAVDGKSLVLYKDHYWQVFEFIEGDHFRGKRDELAESAMNIAQMHQALNVFPLRGQIPILNTVLAPLEGNCWDEVARLKGENKLESFLLEKQQFIKEKICEVQSRLATIHKQEDVIHCDLHPHNFLFFEGRLAAIIDFGQVSIADQENDLAMACHRLVRQYIVHQGKPWQETIADGLNFFLDAYTSVIPMTDQRIVLLPTFTVSLLLRKIVYNFSLYKTGKRSWEPALFQVSRFLAFFEEIDAIETVLA